jgi:hypothetical protein
MKAVRKVVSPQSQSYMICSMYKHRRNIHKETILCEHPLSISLIMNHCLCQYILLLILLYQFIYEGKYCINILFCCELLYISIMTFSNSGLKHLIIISGVIVILISSICYTGCSERRLIGH